MEKKSTVERTLRRLEIEISVSDHQCTLLKAIIQQVCLSYACKEDQLLQVKYRNSKLTEARRIAQFLLHKHTKIPKQRIASYFQRDHSAVMKAIKEFEKLTPQVKYQRELLERYQKIENQIILLKSNSTIKNNK